MPLILSNARAWFALVSLVLLSPAISFAQSGSAGGSLGNDDKAISGSRATPRSAEPDPASRQSQPAEPRGQRKSTGGGGGGGFDGAWVVISAGITCSGGSSTAVVVSSGKIIGQGVNGTVSPSGGVNAVGNQNGVRIISVGRLAGRSGSGSFQQSDGCRGRWSASKQ